MDNSTLYTNFFIADNKTIPRYMLLKYGTTSEEFFKPFIKETLSMYAPAQYWHIRIPCRLPTVHSDNFMQGLDNGTMISQ
jgi:hypothetical protein